MLDDAVVVGSGCRTARRETPRHGAFRNGAYELCEPLVEFETINATP
jgi:hypothetical protein